MSKATFKNNHCLFTSKWVSHFAEIKATLKVLIPLTILIFLMLPAVSFAQASGTPGTAGDFEIDANFTLQNTSLKDWRSVLTIDNTRVGGFVVPGISNIAGENAVWIVDGNSGSGSTKPEGESFKGSSNKNGDYINAAGSPYTIETMAPSTPQKNDLTNIYARAKIISGHTWVMLGAETRSTDGTSYLDFEYNQAGAHTTTTQLIGDGPDGGRTAKTSTKSGDLLFVVDFATGGNSPTPRMFEWQSVTKGGKSSFTWVEKTPLPAAGAYIVTNSADVPSAGFNSGFAGDGTPINSSLALQFVEIGVDLTALGVAGDNVCAPNATVTCKTRTSSSYTSELKDFNLFKFSFVPPSTLTDITNATKCAGENASFSSTAAGDGALASNIKWYRVSGATETLISNGGNYTITTSGQTSTLTISGVAASDAGTYRAKLTLATCGSPSKDATLTINSTATLTAISPLSQNKCPGATETAAFSTTVSGTGALGSNVEWYVGTSTTKLVSGTKYTITSTTTSSTLTINGIVAGDAGTYTAKLTNATCGAPQQSGTLAVNTPPTADAGTDPDAACYVAAGNTFNLAGTGANGAPKWTRVSPTTLPQGVTVAFNNDAIFTPVVTVTGASAGIQVTLRLTVTSNTTPQCGNATDDVIIEVKAQVAGPDAVMLTPTCADKTFKVQVTNPVDATTYTISQPGNNNTYTPITANTVNGVVQPVIFTGLVFGDGFSIIASKNGCVSTPKPCADNPPAINTPGASIQQSVSAQQTIELTSQPTVKAFPNPYSDKVRFSVKSAVSGQATLDLYNLMGQKVKTVFQGHVEAGQIQNVEYAVPNAQRSNLIYIFRVGDQRVSGKLLH